MFVLRFLSSPRFAGALLLWMGLHSVLFALLPPTHSLFQTLQLENRFFSYSFLGSVVLLLLNQFFALLVRLFRSKKMKAKKEEEVFPEISWTDPDGIEVLEETKAGKPWLTYPRPFAEGRAEVQTLLKLENILSLLRLQGFKAQEVIHPETKEESIQGKKGSSSFWGSFLLHLGFLGLLCGLVMYFAWIPTQTWTLWKGESSSFAREIQTPVSGILSSLGLQKDNKTVYPKISLTLHTLNQKLQQPYFVQMHNIQAKEDLWSFVKNSIQTLFLAPKKPMLSGKQKAIQNVQNQAQFLQGDGKTILSMHSGEWKTYNGYIFHLVGTDLQVELTSSQGKKVSLKKGISTQITPQTSVTLLDYLSGSFEEGQKLAKNCLLLSFSHGKKQKESRCIGVGDNLVVDSHSYSWIAPKMGIQLAVQKQGNAWVFFVALLAFLAGFWWFWFPKRYFLEMQWGKKNNTLLIEAQGFGIQPASLSKGMADTLHFPEDWVFPAEKKKREVVSSSRSFSPLSSQASSQVHEEQHRIESNLQKQAVTPIKPKITAVPPVKNPLEPQPEEKTETHLFSPIVSNTKEEPIVSPFAFQAPKALEPLDSISTRSKQMESQNPFEQKSPPTAAIPLKEGKLPVEKKAQEPFLPSPLPSSQASQKQSKPLDLEAVFEGLDSGTQEIQNKGSKKQISEAEIDSLFHDFDQEIKKKD